MVWILGRIYCTGTPEDYKAVHSLQDKMSVVPLSSYGKPYTPPPAQVNPNFDMKTAVRKQVNALDIDAYFTYLAKLMKTNPPTPQDAPMVARDGQDRIGTGAGLRSQQAGRFRSGGDQGGSEAGAAEDGRAPEKAKDNQRLAVLHIRRRQLGHRLSAARHGQYAGTGLEPSAGRGVSALAEGRERRRIQRSTTTT